jgi:hypothetical protein
MASPALGEGAVATAEAGGRHVSLRVEYTQTGWATQVTETDGGTELAREIANSLVEGKRRAEEIAKGYLANKDLKLPAIRWGRIRRPATAPAPSRRGRAGTPPE